MLVLIMPEDGNDIRNTKNISQNSTSTKESAPKSSQGPKPVKIRKPRIKLDKSRSYIEVLERKLSSKIICYYTNATSSIKSRHADIFFEHIHHLDHQEELTLIVISYGGDITAPLRIASILREYCNKLNVLVPSRCASSGTLLALAADKIYMSPAGYLTAVDSSLTMSLNPKGIDGKPARVSVDQVQRVLKFLEEEDNGRDKSKDYEGKYRTLFKYLHPLALGEIDRSSSSSALIAKKMMEMHPQDYNNDDKLISKIADHLVNNYPTHGFPIVYKEAKEIGLPVEKMGKEDSSVLWHLTKLYDQLTLDETTQISPNFKHIEGYPVIIESSEKRTAYRVNYNKRYNTIGKRWEYESDISTWVNIDMSKKDSGKYTITPMDVTSTTTESSGDKSTKDQ